MQTALSQRTALDFRPDQASPLLVLESAGQFVDRLKRCLKSTFTGHSYARRGLHPDTRQQHLRALHELCSLPAELREQSIPFAVLLLERGRIQRKLSWTTVLQQSGAFVGALRRLPQYTMPALQPVMLSHDSMWRDATSHILSNTKAVLPKSHGEISHDTMVKIIEKQSASLHLQMFLILMWAATSRPGDIAQLRTEDVRLLEDEADGKTVASVHFVRGKTLKKQDPYTVFTKIPTPCLSQQEGTEDLFKANTEKERSRLVNQVRAAVRQVDPNTDLRSLRRGSVRHLSSKELDTIMLFTRHASKDTLLKYLGFGQTRNSDSRRMLQGASAQRCSRGLTHP
eukprot:PhM_4_TR13310/c0_g1_i2/m.21013